MEGSLQKSPTWGGAGLRESCFYHRKLLTELNKIDELEKKFNCKISFPSTEEASDIVTVSGPEYQVPLAVDEFLVRIMCLIRHG